MIFILFLNRVLDVSLPTGLVAPIILLLALTIAWLILRQIKCARAASHYAAELKAEKARRSQIDEQAHKLQRVYTVLSEINQSIIHAHGLTELFKRACEIAVEQGGFALAWVGIISPGSQRLRAVAHAGRGGEYLDQINISRTDAPAPHSPIAQTLRTMQRAVNNRIEQSAPMTPCQQVALNSGSAAMASFPLVVGGKIRGALNLYAIEADHFDEAELALLDGLAQDLSFALEFAEQEEQRRWAETETLQISRLFQVLSQVNQLVLRAATAKELFDNVCRIAVELGQFKLAWVGWIDADRQTIQLVAQSGDPSDSLPHSSLPIADPTGQTGPLGAALTLGEPFISVDFENTIWHDAAKEIGFHAMGSFPIRVGGTVCGALSIHVDSRDYFRMKEINLLKEVADDMSFALEHLQQEARRRQTEAAIQESERRYRLAQRAAHIGSWEWDVPSDRLTWSDEMFVIFDEDLAEFIPTNQGVMDRIIEEDKPVAQAAVDAALTVGIPFFVEYRIQDRAHNIKWVESKGEVTFDDQRRPLRAAGTVQDITARKEAETALAESEQRYRELFLANPHPMWVFDLETLRFLDVNDAAIAKYGYTRDEFLAMTIRDIRPPEDVPKLYDYLAAREASYSQPSVWRHCLRDGRIIFVEISSHALDYAGRPARLVLALDVTERLAAEEQIRALNLELEQRVKDRTAQLENSNRELESFAYSVSHDLRAPLRAIDGFSRILEQEYAGRLDEEGKRLLRIIRENASRLDRLIIDLLALSRVGRIELTRVPIDMTALANSIYHEIATPEVRQKFVFQLSVLPEITGDPTLLRQVWTNLISNAIKYTLPHERRVINISGSEQNGICTYTIRDSGVGFNPKYAHKLFNVFQRLHKESEFEGTGVGLAIVQRIVHRHGGQVGAEGEVGQGATFYFSIPQRQAHHA